MIHRYKLNGYNIVIDTCSGSVHAVDEAAYDIISLYGSERKENIAAKVFEKYKDSGVSLNDINECIDDIETLKKPVTLTAHTASRARANTTETVRLCPLRSERERLIFLLKIRAHAETLRLTFSEVSRL